LDRRAADFQALNARWPGSGKRFAELFMRGGAAAALPSGRLFCHIGRMGAGRLKDDRAGQLEVGP
jgi:hypothetical protein